MRGRDIDWIVLTMATALTGIGLAMIYSALQPLGEYASSSSLMFFKRQVLWVAPALVAGFIGFVVPFRFFESLANTLYVLGLILLLVVLIIPSQQETARWLVFGPLRVLADTHQVTSTDGGFMRVLMIFLAIFAVAVFSGCGSKEKKDDSAKQEESNKTAKPAGGGW